MADGDIILCRTDEIPANAARGFDPPAVPAPIFVVRGAGGLYAYANICPHRGTPLDWAANMFLCPNREFIQCSTHAARFAIDTGLCVTGPCAGAFLTPAPIAERDSRIVLLAPGPGPAR